jgi:hypothetical protein
MRSLCFLLSLISIISPAAIHCVESIDVDIPYPITPPSEFTGFMENWQYVRKTDCIFLPFLGLNTAFDKDFNYTTRIFSRLVGENIGYRLNGVRNQLSIYDSTKTDNIHLNLYRNIDSLSLGYRNSSWFNLRKESFYVSSFIAKERYEYRRELFLNFSCFNGKYYNHIHASFSKFYRYSNAFTIMLQYSYSPFFTQSKSLQTTLKNRFGYEDYLFLTPGISGTFFSKTFFTPFLNGKYLINKYLSMGLNIRGTSLHTNLTTYSHPQYTELPSSLERPIDIATGLIDMSIMLDRNIKFKLEGCVRKTKHPIIKKEKNSQILEYTNVDTTITFTYLSANFIFSKKIFKFDSQLSVLKTPYYKKKLPYSPSYKLFMELTINPIRKLALSNNIDYFSHTYDGDGRKIASHYILCSSLEFSLTKFVFLKASVLNILDNKSRFLGDIHYPGRALTTGIKLIF